MPWQTPSLEIPPKEPETPETRHPQPRIIAPDVTIVGNLKKYHSAPATAQTIAQALTVAET